MPNTESLSFKVFVSFGGAGASALSKLAELVAQDHELGRVAGRLYSFVLVDSDVAQLDAHQKSIRGALEPFLIDKNDLMVETITLGDSFGAGFSTVVLDAVTQKTEEGMKRLAEAWWYDGSTPFVGRYVINPEIGAGQMPLVSRFMAWRGIGEVERVAEKIMNGIKARAQGAEKNVKVMYISSLAGGTGRGCWSTFALKFKECFDLGGIKIEPNGLFLDANCFHYTTDEDAIRSLRLNSLTGISELAMWFRNDRSMDKKLGYHLPALNRPEDPAVDCIDTVRAQRATGVTDPRFQLQLGSSPVSRALMVFGSNRISSPDNGEAYQAIIGGALYSIIRSTDYWSASSNETEYPMFGLGSSLAGIPAGSLLKYFKARAQGVLCSWPLDEQKSNAAAAALAKELTLRLAPAEIGKKVTSRLLNRGTIIEYLENIGAGGEATKTKQNAKRAINLAEELDGAPPKGVPIEVKAVVENLIKEDKGIGAEVLEAQKAAGLGQSEFELIAYYIVAKVATALRQTGRIEEQDTSKDEKVSETINLAGARTVLEQMRQWCLDQAAELGKQQSGTSIAPTGLKALTVKCSGKALIFFGEPFDEEKRRQLQEAAETTVRSKLNPVLGATLKVAYEKVAHRIGESINMLGRLKKIFVDFSERSAEIAEPYKAQCFIALGGKGNPNFRRLLAAETYSQTEFIERVLKFPVSEETLGEYDNQIVAQLQGKNEKNKELNDAALRAQNQAVCIVADALVAEVREEGELDFDHCEEIRKEVRNALKEAVKNVAIDHEYVRANFNLLNWLQATRRVYIQAVLRSQDQDREALQRQFQKWFGMTIESEDSQIEIEKMYANFVAVVCSGCHPMMEWREGERKMAGVIAAVPQLGMDVPDLENNLKNSPAALAAGKRTENWRITIESSDKTKASSYNPFSIIAMSWDPFPDWRDNVNFGGVDSVDYWKRDPELVKLLEAAERADVSNNIVMEKSPLREKGGVGYIDPRFVLGPWRNLRWKPWDKDSLHAVGTNEDADLMAYLVFGNLNEAVGDVEQRKAFASIVDRLSSAEFDWKVPLCENRENAWRWGRKLRVSSSISATHHEEGRCDWTKGEVIAPSLKKFIEQVLTMNAEVRRGVTWEIRFFKTLLPKLDLARQEKVLLIQLSKQYVDWLIDFDAKKNYSGKEDDVKKMSVLLAEVRSSMEILLNH
jgi:hypothetical protein